MAVSAGSSGNGETLIFTCAGAAHAGQVANRAGVKLAQQEAGKLFCVAAVGAGIADKMERARNAAARVVIDGCEDYCARKIMEQAVLPVDLHVTVTDLGIGKPPAQPNMALDTKCVVNCVQEALTNKH